MRQRHPRGGAARWDTRARTAQTRAIGHGTALVPGPALPHRTARGSGTGFFPCVATGQDRTLRPFSATSHGTVPARGTALLLCSATGHDTAPDSDRTPGPGPAFVSRFGPAG